MPHHWCWLCMPSPKEWKEGRLSTAQANAGSRQNIRKHRATLSLLYEGRRKASDADIKRICSALRRFMNLMDGMFSKLRTPHGEVQESDFFLRESLAEVDRIWKELGLSQTPKYHALIAHAIIQATVREKPSRGLALSLASFKTPLSGESCLGRIQLFSKNRIFRLLLGESGRG
jgi:hypothetical protein